MPFFVLVSGLMYPLYYYLCISFLFTSLYLNIMTVFTKNPLLIGIIYNNNTDDDNDNNNNNNKKTLIIILNNNSNNNTASICPNFRISAPPHCPHLSRCDSFFLRDSFHSTSPRALKFQPSFILQAGHCAQVSPFSFPLWGLSSVVVVVLIFFLFFLLS